MPAQTDSCAAQFSSRFDECHAEVERIVAQVRLPTAGAVEDLLRKSLAEPLGLAELAQLLEIGNTPGAAEQFAALRSFVHGRFRRPTGNRLRYIAPIYLSSHCADRCGYCNFSAARTDQPRKRLGLAELEDEVAAVLATGARVIELVLATDPEMPWPLLARYVARTAEMLAGQPGAAVLLCSEYLPAEAYCALREAGLWGMVQWDETLARDAYRRWHAASPSKRHLEVRMDNHDRALAAGLEVAAGALFGLADYRFDALMQIAKARFLADGHGRRPFVFGTARLKPIAGRELHPAAEVNDRAYETALLVYKVAAPAVGRWLQTRETFALNLVNMLDGDVFTYRCGDVRPGGHRDADSLPVTAAGQFGVHELSREAVERTLAESGFQIDYAWTARGPGSAFH